MTHNILRGKNLSNLESKKTTAIEQCPLWKIGEYNKSSYSDEDKRMKNFSHKILPKVELNESKILNILTETKWEYKYLCYKIKITQALIWDICMYVEPCV